MAAFMACGHAKYTGQVGVCLAPPAGRARVLPATRDSSELKWTHDCLRSAMMRDEREQQDDRKWNT